MPSNEENYLAGAKLGLAAPTAGYKQSRTGVDCISNFGDQITYDLSEGFPLFTTKRMPFKTIVNELLWFLSGSTDLRPLLLKNVHVWDDNAFQYYLQRNRTEDIFPVYSKAWHDLRQAYLERVKSDEGFAEENRTLGRIYGQQWRNWITPEGKSIDQIDNVLEEIAKNPSSRRLIVSAWNPGELDKVALPCCCSIFQLYSRDGKLDLKLFQRSADKFLGEPWNVASHSLLLQIFAEQTGLEAGRFIHSFGDAHFYCGRNERGRFYAQNFPEIQRRVSSATNAKDYLEILDGINRVAPSEREGEDGLDHVTAILEQLARMPKPAPRVKIAKKPLCELVAEDFELDDYSSPFPPIKRRMAV